MRKIAKDSADWTYDSMQSINTPRGSIFRQVRGFLSTKRGNKTDSSIDELSAQNPAKLSKRQRAGFTMIELIFSIVIVGLVILSIPLIVRQSNLNTITSQNVIGYYNALTLMETIKSKPWDKNNVDDFQKSGVYYILNTGNGRDCFTFTNPNAQDNLILAKTGLSLGNKRRMCDPDNKSASAISGDNDLDSINSFSGYTTKVSNNGEDIFRLDVAIRYVGIDFNGNSVANPDNIKDSAGFDDVKEIKITLVRLVDGVAVTDDDGDEGVAVLTYYAANIGNDIPLVKDNVENVLPNP